MIKTKEQILRSRLIVGLTSSLTLSGLVWIQMQGEGLEPDLGPDQTGTLASYMNRPKYIQRSYADYAWCRFSFFKDYVTLKQQSPRHFAKENPELTRQAHRLIDRVKQGDLEPLPVNLKFNLGPWRLYKGKAMWRVGEFDSCLPLCETGLPRASEKQYVLIMLPANEEGLQAIRKIERNQGTLLNGEDVSVEASRLYPTLRAEVLKKALPDQTTCSFWEELSQKLAPVVAEYSKVAEVGVDKTAKLLSSVETTVSEALSLPIDTWAFRVMASGKAQIDNLYECIQERISSLVKPSKHSSSLSNASVNSAVSSSSDKLPLVMCLHLCSWAEHFAEREIPLAINVVSRKKGNLVNSTQNADSLCFEDGVVAEQQVGFVLFEGPLRGNRRPKSRPTSQCVSTAEFLNFGISQIMDSRGLLEKFRAIGFEDFLMSGVSAGGAVAAMTISSLQASYRKREREGVEIDQVRNLGGVFLMSGLSPVPTWTTPSSAMYFSVDRMSLRKAVFAEGMIDGDENKYLSRMLAPLDLSSWPALSEDVCKNSTFVGAQSDAIIPAWSQAQLARLLEIKDLRWVRGGHVTGALLKLYDFEKAIVDGAMKVGKKPVGDTVPIQYEKSTKSGLLSVD